MPSLDFLRPVDSPEYFMQETERKIIIFGARSFAEEVADLASEIPGVRVAGFVENLDRNHPPNLHGIPVHWIDDVAPLAATHQAVCALGTVRRRSLIERAKAMGFVFVALIHPSARVSQKSTIGEGSMVSAGCIIAAHSVVGAHVIINRGALVGHHLEIGDYANVGPGANIGGGSRIGSGAYIGIGATVIDHITIGAESVIGAGAVVTKNIPANVLAVGAPAKIVKEGIEGK